MRLKVSNVCQLINKAKIDATKTVYGITFTNDGSGVIIANGGPSTGQGAFYVDREVRIDPTHIYLNPKSADIPGTCALGCDLYGDDGYIPGSENGYERDVPFKFNSRGEIAVFYYVIFANKTVSNLRLIPQLFDLTEMYGAGNEPTTVAQFRQDFPNEMYDYSPECWKKFRRLKYIANKQPVQLYAKNIWKEYTDLYGVSIKNNNDGSITLNGTATQTFYYTNRLDYEIKPNHKYLYFDYYPQTPSWDSYVGGCEGKVDHEGLVQFAIYNLNNDGTIDPSSSTLPSNTLLNTFCICYKGFTFNNITIKPQLFDLTEMYGAGNEPTTVAQFRADFPNELYDYNPYTYLTLNRGKFIANKEPIQLLYKSKYPATITNVGVTFTNNGDGTITLNGTNAGGGTNLYSFMRVSVKAWHYYYIYSGQAGTWGTCMFTVDKSISANIIDGYIGLQGNSFDNCDAYLFIGEGATFNNYVVKPQFFDLTEMYGAGNEPKTVAQFRADFPNALYDYNPYNAITFR